jgi:hypothetical protein
MAYEQMTLWQAILMILAIIQCFWDGFLVIFVLDETAERASVFFNALRQEKNIGPEQTKAERLIIQKIIPVLIVISPLGLLFYKIAWHSIEKKFDVRVYAVSL